MPQYMLLLYDNAANMQRLSPEEMQKATEKYMAWRNLPFTKDGKRLADGTGRVIRPENGKPMVQALPRLYAQDSRGVKGRSTDVAASPKLTRNAINALTRKPSSTP